MLSIHPTTLPLFVIATGSAFTVPLLARAADTRDALGRAPLPRKVPRPMRQIVTQYDRQTIRSRRWRRCGLQSEQEQVLRTDVEIVGNAGPAVLLLPGGAESATDFFPGLPEALVQDPGCRVILHDRPGTGHSAAPGLLADAADHLHRVITDLDCGPVVVVGQSLGGAVALLLADAHPSSVAGLVLLDPTPINDVTGCANLERTLRVVRPLASVPLLRSGLQALLRSGMRRSMRGKDLRPDCRTALEAIGNLDIARLAAAVQGIGAIAEHYVSHSHPALPTVVVTADRKASSSIAKSHEDLAERLGATLERWSGAAHNLHLDHPEQTVETVRDMLRTAVPDR